MPTSANLSTLKTGGVSTAFTGAACSLVTGKTYQMNDATKRVLDPAVAVAVTDNGVTVATTNYEVDYLYGKVTFATAYTVTGPVVVSAGNYLPGLSLAKVTDYSFTCTADVPAVTEFGNAAVTRQSALKDLSGSLTTLELPQTDLDAGGGTTKLQSLFDNGTPMLLELGFPGGGFFRAWVIIESLDTSGAVDGLVEFTIGFSGAAQLGTGQTESTSFGYGA